MTATVLVVHLEGATPALLRRWSQEGCLPTLGRIAASGVESRLTSRGRMLPFSSWTEFNTGVSAVRSGIVNVFAQRQTGELRPRQVTQDELPDDYWTVASRAGRRVAAIDPVLAKFDPAFEGLLLQGWTAHDCPFGSKSQPGSLLGEVIARWGEPRLRQHRLHQNDQFSHHACGLTPHGELAGALGADASRKGGLVVELLRNEHWDLLVCAFSELHCAGHGLWGQAGERQDRSATDAEDDPLLAAYRYVDAQLSKIVEAAGTQATVIVVTTGGIGPPFSSASLLSEVPSRLGMQQSRRLRMSANKALPTWLYQRLRPVATQSLRNRLGLGPASFFELRPGDKTRVMPVHNGTAGAFRLNLAGREPCGTVQPGREADEILNELTRELLELRVDPSGEPLCERVVRVADEFGPDAHADLPDLIVLMPLEGRPAGACVSNRIGRIQLRTRDASYIGDHTGESHVWITGPGVNPNATLDGADLIDIAPTVLAKLGVDIPAGMHGRSLVS